MNSDDFVMPDVEAMSGIKDDLQEIIRLLRKISPFFVIMDQWLDNQEVSLVMRISKRTLSTYRTKGILPYSQIEGKIYYKSSDISLLLEKNYKTKVFNK